MPAEPERFADLFNHPTVEKMHALSPREFERFVGYVLRRAGYEVKEVRPHFLHDVHLELSLPGKTRVFGGVECRRLAPDKLVTARMVKGVKNASAVKKPGTRPFFVTTSDFNEAAHLMAEVGTKRAHLLNGAQFVRYITYIRGSRHDDDNTITSLSPEFFAGRERPHKRSTGNTTILTIANNKGGVGKTTTAYYLGAELAKLGERVLLIDLDGQANLTEWCFNGLAPDRHDEIERPLNITGYFSGARPLHTLITPAGKDRLSIVPSDPFLRLRDLGGSGRPDIELQFVQDVEGLRSQAHESLGGTPTWIIIDTPPAMSVFTRAALAAADFVIAPIRPRRASLQGTQNMLDTLKTANSLRADDAKFLGIVVTHSDDLVLSRRWEEIDLPRALPGFGGTVFQNKIPIDNRLETLEPGANTPGGRAYAALAQEVMQSVKQRLSNDHSNGTRQSATVSAAVTAGQ
jgi:chromosome partitioning protein